MQKHLVSLCFCGDDFCVFLFCLFFPLLPISGIFGEDVEVPVGITVLFDVRI